MVDENLTHHVGGHAEEMGAPGKVGLTAIEQAEVSLMDKRGRLQRVTFAFATKVIGSQIPQLRIYVRQHSIDGCFIARRELTQRGRNGFRNVHMLWAGCTRILPERNSQRYIFA